MSFLSNIFSVFESFNVFNLAAKSVILVAPKMPNDGPSQSVDGPFISESIEVRDFWIGFIFRLRIYFIKTILAEISYWWSRCCNFRTSTTTGVKNFWWKSRYSSFCWRKNQISSFKAYMYIQPTLSNLERLCNQKILPKTSLTGQCCFYFWVSLTGQMENLGRLTVICMIGKISGQFYLENCSPRQIRLYKRATVMLY